MPTRKESSLGCIETWCGSVSWAPTFLLKLKVPWCMCYETLWVIFWWGVLFCLFKYHHLLFVSPVVLIVCIPLLFFIFLSILYFVHLFLGSHYTQVLLFPNGVDF